MLYWCHQCNKQKIRWLVFHGQRLGCRKRVFRRWHHKHHFRAGFVKSWLLSLKHVSFHGRQAGNCMVEHREIENLTAVYAENLTRRDTSSPRSYGWFEFY